MVENVLFRRQKPKCELFSQTNRSLSLIDIAFVRAIYVELRLLSAARLTQIPLD